MMTDGRTAALDACEAVLNTPAHNVVTRALQNLGAEADAFLSSLAIRRSRDATDLLQRVMTSLGPSCTPGTVEHHLIVAVAREHVDGIEAAPVPETTKYDLYDAFAKLASPIPQLRSKLRAGHSWFRSAAKIVTLERFPGGAYEWEISGFPRSWFLKVQKSRLPELLSILAIETRGLRPFFAPHLSILRVPGSRLTEPELTKAYVQMARGMEFQPAIKGMVAASWLYHPKLPLVSPHIYDVMHRQVVEGQGFIADMGPVDPIKSGALSKSGNRRRLFEAGEWQPRSGVVIWPRRKMMEWAAQF